MYVYDAKEAAGETVTIGMRKGDQLANGSKDIPCEHNIRHNGTMYATANMVRARACGKLVLGDKANPQTTFHLNEGHVTDMCEIGGDLQSQRDVHYEVKVPSALTKTRQAVTRRAAAQNLGSLGARSRALNNLFAPSLPRRRWAARPRQRQRRWPATRGAFE